MQNSTNQTKHSIKIHNNWMYQVKNRVSELETEK